MKISVFIFLVFLSVEDLDEDILMSPKRGDDGAFKIDSGPNSPLSGKFINDY